jgi:hypothetical protein
MQKKSTPRKPRAATTPHKKSRAELRKELAQDIARILAHPELPIYLYNKFSRGITEFQNECITYNYEIVDSAEVIEKTLTIYAKEQGGTQHDG